MEKFGQKTCTIPEGYFGAVSVNEATGEGVLSVLVNVPTSSFQVWLDYHNLTAADALPTGDTDADGRGQLVEFGTGGNPFSGTGDPMIQGSMADDGGTSYFTWIVPVLDGGTFSGTPLSVTINGVSYTLRCSSTLGAGREHHCPSWNAPHFSKACRHSLWDIPIEASDLRPPARSGLFSGWRSTWSSRDIPGEHLLAGTRGADNDNAIFDPPSVVSLFAEIAEVVCQ